MLERNDGWKWVARLAQLCAVAALCVSVAAAAGAEAQRKGKRQRGKARKTEAPVSAEIANTMGDLRWGMSKDEVLAWVSNQVKEKYRKELSKATDAVAEDRLRHRMNEELRAINESFVRFDGKTTGWDVSYLRDEFTHNNRESMLVVRDRSSQNHYFFINDQLWKWYKAFDARVFQGKAFGEFAAAVQGRFGTAKENQGELMPGTGTRQWLEWQDQGTRLRAVDQTHFYGFYCLVFEDKGTLSRLASLRRNAPQRRGESHAVVDAVTSDGREANDGASNIVDRITGKNRARETTAARSSAGRSSGRGAERAPAPPPAPVMTGVSESDDPLRGLDF